MTINADLYRGPGLGTKVATLTRGQLNDFAHNQWQAPANTFLEPDTDYWFVLDCISGCANDNWAQLGATYSDRGGWRRRTRMVHSRSTAGRGRRARIGSAETGP